MSDDTNKPVSATDLRQALKDLERDLKQFIVEREVSSIRWFIGIFGALEATYFCALYFLISHLQK